jgi:hypothetical protein
MSPTSGRLPIYPEFSIGTALSLSSAVTAMPIFLAQAYKDHGPDAFAYEVLDKLEPQTEGGGQDYGSELETLLSLRMEQGLTAEDGEPVKLVPMY